MQKYPTDLSILIAYLKKLPGVGSKTAERFAFQLLTWPESQLKDFADLVKEIKVRIRHCPDCHCLMEENHCGFCDRTKRDSHALCIIASAKDAFAIEETHAYRGLYHVIGGLLSPLDGRHPDQLKLDELKKRIDDLRIKEVIIALDSTLEGDTTALYLKEHFRSWGLAVTRLAFGLPMGSSLDFVDGGTLARALMGRQSF
ncbi:MAG TPA: recombination mediator RecR [Rhabdochlamydiaceae bacterium]|nr:recombination mediator RecR [Rhabdochlamydiaceae bacterium]